MASEQAGEPLGKLTSIAVLLAFAAISMGKPPVVLREVRMAQLMLIKDFQAAKWGMGLLLT
jgi:hypothetical protein